MKIKGTEFRDILSEIDQLAAMDSEEAHIWERVRLLTPGERNLLLLYNELGTYRALAAALNMSTTTTFRRVKKIIKKIKEC